jgi:hypothetical protein
VKEREADCWRRKTNKLFPFSFGMGSKKLVGAVFLAV